MKAKDLVNQKALRTVPVKMERQGMPCSPFSTSYSNYNYTDEPVTILKATDHHIIVETSYGKTIVLNKLYCDDNWISYDELMKDIKTDKGEN